MKKLIITIFLISCILINPGIAEHKIFDGTNWLNTSSQFPSVKNIAYVKDIYIRASEGTALFSGSPNIVYNANNKAKIISNVDDIYKNKNNTFLPLYYTIQIIGMQKKGVPANRINLYILQIKRNFTL